MLSNLLGQTGGCNSGRAKPSLERHYPTVGHTANISVSFCGGWSLPISTRTSQTAESFFLPRLSPKASLPPARFVHVSTRKHAGCWPVLRYSSTRNPRCATENCDQSKPVSNRREGMPRRRTLPPAKPQPPVRSGLGCAQAYPESGGAVSHIRPLALVCPKGLY